MLLEEGHWHAEGREARLGFCDYAMIDDGCERGGLYMLDDLIFFFFGLVTIDTYELCNDSGIADASFLVF